MQDHLCPRTGWLSIDVMNILGAGQLGVHVEENSIDWTELQRCAGSAALVNWNQTHWTVLQPWPLGEAPTHWRHTNSCIVGGGLRYGRRECQREEVGAVLREIAQSCGGVALHRITRGAAGGEAYLEPAGRRAMLPVEELAREDAGAHAAPRDGAEAGSPRRDTLRLVTLNVAGLWEAHEEPARRMDAILTKVLAVDPDVMCFQEMIDEMYGVLKQRLPRWSFYHRREREAD